VKIKLCFLTVQQIFFWCWKDPQDSRLLVQERYESLRSTFSENIWNIDTYVKENQPEKNSPQFIPVNMILQTATALLYKDNTATAETFETGLLTYGNANPDSPNFNSLADFICSGDDIEIRLPWQLLNFADPLKWRFTMIIMTATMV